jgi:hypothetical protein
MYEHSRRRVGVGMRRDGIYEHQQAEGVECKRSGGANAYVSIAG